MVAHPTMAMVPSLMKKEKKTSPKLNNKKRWKKLRRWLPLLTLLAIMAIGLIIRLKDLPHYWENPEKYTLNGVYIPRAGEDSYRFLTMARDLIEDKYESVNKMRSVPTYLYRPDIPPLLSGIIFTCFRVTGIPIDVIGAYLPALLGVILALPIFLLGRLLSNSTMGLIAAFMSLISSYYAIRSSFCWLDTDCMNVTFSTFSAYFALRCAVARGWRRVPSLFFLVVTYLLYLWWWDEGTEAVTILTLLPLLPILIFHIRLRRWIVIVCIILIVGMAGGYLYSIRDSNIFQSIYNHLEGQYQFLSGQQLSNVPNVGKIVVELSRPELKSVVKDTAGNMFSFLICLFGTFWLLFARWRECTVLVSLFILAILTYFGSRFLIFLTPVVSLGLGFFITQLYSHMRKSKISVIICVVCSLLCIYPTLKLTLSKNLAMFTHSKVIAAMASFQKTPKNSVVWATWEIGFALNYWGRRATVIDGSGRTHFGMRTVYNTFPLATSDIRLAANFIRFYVKHGQRGIRTTQWFFKKGEQRTFDFIKKVLSAGPVEAKKLLVAEHRELKPGSKKLKQWLRFFYPSKSRPVYLFLDNRITKTFYWWYWHGTYNMRTRVGEEALYTPIPDYLFFHNNRIVSKNKVVVDIEKGMFYGSKNPQSLNEVTVRNETGLQTYQCNQSSQKIFHLLEPKHFGVLMNKKASNSTFSQLFLEYRISKYFEPVKLESPWYQVWGVCADNITKQ